MPSLEQQPAPPLMKRSRTKLWIRSAILLVFGTIFGLAIYRDISVGAFQWAWAAMAWLVALPVGYLMSRIVPMQVHGPTRNVTMSFDRVYFALIVVLVFVKGVAGNLLGATVLSDSVMSVILGLMVGRLSGTCLRIRRMKTA